MAERGVERRLVAILCADVVGYTRLAWADEEGTIARLRAIRQELIDPIVAAHRGRSVKLMRDERLVEFANVRRVVRLSISERLHGQNAGREISAGKAKGAK